MRYEVPATVSPQAKVALEQTYVFLKQIAQAPQVAPVTQEDWDRRNAMANAVIGPRVKATTDAINISVHEEVLAGVPVLRIRPPGYTPRMIGHGLHRTSIARSNAAAASLGR